MARAEPETTSHAEQDAPALSPESPAGAPSAAASLLLGAAAGARVVARGLPRLSNAGVQALARAAAATADFQVADDVVSALVRESQNESLLRADTVERAFRFLDKASIGDMQDVFRRTEQHGGFQRLVDVVDFPPEGVDKARVRVAVLAWRHRRRASRAMFEIEHRDDLAKLTATDREDFLSWIGLEAGAVTQLHAHRGLQVAQPGGSRPPRRLRGGGRRCRRARSASSRSCSPTPRPSSTKGATFTKFLHDQKGIAARVADARARGSSTDGARPARSTSRTSSSRSGKADAVRTGPQGRRVRRQHTSRSTCRRPRCRPGS